MSELADGGNDLAACGLCGLDSAENPLILHTQSTSQIVSKAPRRTDGEMGSHPEIGRAGIGLERIGGAGGASDSRCWLRVIGVWTEIRTGI